MDTEENQLTKKQRRALRKEQEAIKRATAQRAGTMKRVVVWVGVIAAVALFVVFVSRAGTSESGSGVTEGWPKGSESPELTIVEYSDFQCPACAAYYPVAKQIFEEFGDRIKFVYKHFPLSSIHPNAVDAARAAEAAGQQGAFWDMHNMLFEHQDEWSRLRNPDDQFAEYARIIGLDEAAFIDAYNGDVAQQAVDAAAREARIKGLRGTPTFFIDGIQIENPAGYDAFKSLIVERIGEAPTLPDFELLESASSTPASEQHDQTTEQTGE